VPRSQIQVALTTDNQHWFLLNASPDLRTQIESTPELHPRGLRDTPIAGVVLTTGDLDQVLGLLLMRELQPIRIYATDAVRSIVQRQNAFFNMLAQHEGQSRWLRIDAASQFSLAANGSPALDCQPVPLGSGFPAWVPPPLAKDLPREEAVLGLVIQQAGSDRRLGYFPACGKITPEMTALLESCDVVLFDGTFWADDELQRAEPGARTARQMGHVPLGGSDGTLALLSGLHPRTPTAGALGTPLRRQTTPAGQLQAQRGPQRKILLHINNTNPLLDRDSAEHRQAVEAGWEIAEDGWDIQL